MMMMMMMISNGNFWPHSLLDWPSSESHANNVISDHVALLAISNCMQSVSKSQCGPSQCNAMQKIGAFSWFEDTIKFQEFHLKASEISI